MLSLTWLECVAGHFICLLPWLCFTAYKIGDILNLLILSLEKEARLLIFDPKAGQIVSHYGQSSWSAILPETPASL